MALSVTGTLGEDSHPVFDRSHKSVVLLDDGTYGNGADEIAAPTVDNRKPTADIYDLAGRKVDASGRMSRGIYVVNGKKLFVK